MTANRKTLCRDHEPGHAHALTFSCFRNQKFLSRDRSCRWVIEAIAFSREKHAFHVWAYVVMPEHVHLLIWPTGAGHDIGKILATIKQSVHHKAVAFLRREAPKFLQRLLDRQPNGKEHLRFWQRGGGYDRNITEPETVWAEIEYIHANPVRRGLCNRAEDWRWSSSAAYLFGHIGPLPIDRESLPRTSRG